MTACSNISNVIVPFDISSCNWAILLPVICEMSYKGLNPTLSSCL